MANEQVNIRLEAQDNASAKLKNVRNEVDKVGASAKTTAAQAKGLQDGVSGVGRNAGMAGIQVQQFVGQLQGGVNPMVALSQQSADLGFALGVPLAGAIVSIAAVIAGTLIPSLMQAEQSFADLRKEAEGVGIGLNQLPTKITEQNLLLLGTTAGQAGTKVQDLQKQLQKLKGDLIIAQAVGDNADEFSDLGTNVETTEAEIAKLELELAKANVQLDIANKNVMNFSDALYGQYKRAQDAKNAITNYYDGIKAANVNDVDHLATLRNKAEALKAQINPLYAYNQAVQEYERMAANQLISDEQLAIAKEKLRDRLLGVKDSLDIVNLSMKDIKKSGIQSLEDGLVGLIDGTKSVKDAFKDMARSVISSLIRMQIQQSITAPLAQAMGLSVGARAIGGPVSAGKPYLVGERGPELIVPHSSGNVIPNNELGTTAPVNVTLNISTGVAQTVRTEIANLLPQITNATKAAVVDARRRGGSFAGAFGA